MKLNKVKILAGILSVFFTASNLLYAQETIEVEEGGYLGISFPVIFNSQQNKIAGQNFGANHFSMPFLVLGASPDYAVVTSMLIASDFFRFENYYKPKPDFGISGEIYHFSFFNFEILYEAMSVSQFKFHLGSAFGHQGFLINGYSKSHQFFMGLSTAVYWFFHDHFFISYKFQVPMGLYNKNISKILHFKNTLELSYDPIGPILNPSYNSVLLSAGFMLDYASFKAFDMDVSYLHYKPYLAVTVLY